jgi:hypothetical protein
MESNLVLPFADGDSGQAGAGRRIQRVKHSKVAFLLFLTSFLADANLVRAGGPASGSKVHELDAAALARLIDEHVEQRLKAEQIPSSPRTDDAEFLRRVYLDIHGVIPSVDQARAFLDSNASDRRIRLVDELLANSRYGAHFADIWHNHLYPANANQRIKPEALVRWLEQGFQTKTWDRLVYDLMTATGSQEQNGAVTYMLKGRFTLSVTEMTDLTSRNFLGVRLNCAQCHNHPFASWKQSDYWGMAAFFTQIQRLKPVVAFTTIMETNVDPRKLPESDLLREPRFLGGDVLKAAPEQSLRKALADWMVAKDNPFFARAMVNRMWGHFFGRGLVHPVDDMHEGNSPSHPELLAALSDQFKANGFDLRYLCRAICQSETYQRTSKPLAGNAKDDQLFSRMLIKVLTPEQLFDSLVLATGNAGNRSSTGKPINNPRAEFVSFFRSEGEIDPTSYSRGIPQALRLMNSGQFLGPRSEALITKQLVEPGATPAQAVERLYLRVLSRRPSDVESQLMLKYLEQPGAQRQQLYAEIAWVLLMSSEFSLNH